MRDSGVADKLTDHTIRIVCNQRQSSDWQTAELQSGKKVTQYDG